MANFRRDNRSGGGRRDFGRRDFGDRRDRQMFSTVCSNCGKNCEVPFRPTGDKPVYCDDCFKVQKRNSGPSRYDDRRGRRDSFGSSASPQNSTQLDAINAKLTKILEILAPTPIKTEVIEVKTAKPQPEVPVVVEAKPVKEEAKKKTAPKKKTPSKKK